jgi:hypothetical protein
MYAFAGGVVPAGPMTEQELGIANALSVHFGMPLEELHVVTDGGEARAWWWSARGRVHVLYAYGRALRGGGADLRSPESAAAS